MPKTIAVIDGNSLMHRAYHAIQTPMTSLDNTPTNAVFGFFQMFCKFVEDMSPDAVVCAFDAGRPTHRLADLPAYKAQRPHMDDELRVQFPVVEDLLTSMEVPVVKVEGWEGDDILGTVSARDEALGYKTLLLTGDKDACQLVSDLTSVVNTKKGISEVVVLDPAGVVEKYGVSPAQFPDYLGLMGDSSDNIPGVAGIGPKSASTILQKYGTIENAYAHIDEFKGKQREKLETSRDLAYLSRQIATIVRDLDFDLDLEGLSFPHFDPSQVEAAFRKYSLVSPLTRVLRLADEKPHLVTSRLEPEKRVERSKWKELLTAAVEGGERVGFALELGAQGTIFGTSVTAAFSTESAGVVLHDEEAAQALLYLLEKGALATLDLKRAIELVYPADSGEPALLSEEALYAIDGFDVALGAYLLDSTLSSYTHAALCDKYLGVGMEEAGSLEDDVALRAQASRLLAPKLTEALTKDASMRVFNEIDLPLVPVLAQMERIGVAIDAASFAELARTSAAQIDELTSEIYAIAGEEFNIDSPKQLGHILFEVLGLPPTKKTRRGYSTDATVLRELAKTSEIASLVMSYREFSKIKGTYIDALPKMRGADGRIHTTFNQTITATGRLSSSDPNLQNIPVRSDFGRLIRQGFIPLREGDVFMAADYSQIELRLLAHLSGDAHLIDAFCSGADFHAMTASRVFATPLDEVTPRLRSRAKAVNFGIVYGQQAFGLAQALDIPRREAQEMIDLYFAAYPSVRSYLDSIVSEARATGSAQTMFGRKRHVPEVRSSNRMRAAAAERTAMNHPMQGSAADIIKLAMIEVARRLREGGFEAKLLLQVHDELDLSVPEDEISEVSALLKDVMENVVLLAVPLSVDVSWGPDWASAH